MIKIRYDTTDVKATEDIIENKNAYITTLRKKLKLPSTEDPQSKEIEESEWDNEEMLKLIIEKKYTNKEDGRVDRKIT